MAANSLPAKPALPASTVATICHVAGRLSRRLLIYDVSERVALRSTRMV